MEPAPGEEATRISGCRGEKLRRRLYDVYGRAWLMLGEIKSRGQADDAASENDDFSHGWVPSRRRRRK